MLSYVFHVSCFPVFPTMLLLCRRYWIRTVSFSSRPPKSGHSSNRSSTWSRNSHRSARCVLVFSSVGSCIHVWGEPFKYITSRYVICYVCITFCSDYVLHTKYPFNLAVTDNITFLSQHVPWVVVLTRSFPHRRAVCIGLMLVSSG